MVPGVQGSAGPEALVQDCPPAAAACKMAPFSKQKHQHCFILFFGLYPPFQTWNRFLYKLHGGLLSERFSNDENLIKYTPKIQK